MKRVSSLVLSFAALMLAASVAFAGTSAPAASAAAPAAPATTAAAANLVDLNSATKAELMKLPGIGEAISDRIIKARPFANKSQLLSKGLVSKAVYDKLSSLVIAKKQ